MTRNFHKLVLAAAFLCVWMMPASAQLSDAAKADASEFALLPGDGLDWTPSPGAFERSLRRRNLNPIFAPNRRFISPDELRNAIIQDAGDARKVLLEFVDLALEQRRLRRLSDATEIQEALARVDLSIRSAAETGGNATALAGQMQRIRSHLLTIWRERTSEDTEVQAMLAAAEREIARQTPRENNPFVSQLMRSDGPIVPRDLAAALLSEDVSTIVLAMRFLDPKRRSVARRDAATALTYVRLEGAEIEGLDARLQALQ